MLSRPLIITTETCNGGGAIIRVRSEQAIPDEMNTILWLVAHLEIRSLRQRKETLQD